MSLLRMRKDNFNLYSLLLRRKVVKWSRLIKDKNIKEIFFALNNLNC